MAVVTIMSALCILSLCVVNFVDSNMRETRRQLIRDKLKMNDILVHPRLSVDTLTEIKVKFILWNLLEVNEKEQSVTISGWLEIKWKDESLAWDLEDYNVTDVFFKQKDIWVPDIAITNTMNNVIQLGFADFYIRVTHDGIINWDPNELFKTTCEMDITYFPLDIQTCNITLGPHISMEEFRFVLSDTDMYKVYKSENSHWSVDSIHQHQRMVHGVSLIDFVIVFHRLPSYYILNMLLPIICISVLISFVFAIPLNLADRVSFAMTVLLTFVLFLTIVSDNLPKTSQQTSCLTIYITILLIFSALAVVLSIVTLKISCFPDNKPIPSCLQGLVTQDSGRIVLKENIQTIKDDEVHECQNAIKPSKEDDKVRVPTWKDVSNGLDYIFLIGFFVSILGINVTFFLFLGVSSQILK